MISETRRDAHYEHYVFCVAARVNAMCTLYINLILRVCAVQVYVVPRFSHRGRRRHPLVHLPQEWVDGADLAIGRHCPPRSAAGLPREVRTNTLTNIVSA